jgi:succinate dehydrogenase / fumarate reductase iron-sulfur subunit
MSADGERTITFHIRRYDPERGGGPRWESYRVPWSPGLTVLDGLWLVKERHAPDLAWRSSCRMGVCGSCGMLINGRARLGCNTQVAELGSDAVTVAPLANFAIVRDLVPDLRSMFAAHADLAPWLIRPDRDEQERPTAEYRQTPEELEEYLQFTYCIKCGCCMAACPTLALDPVYSGPMPLAQAHRYDADKRDAGFAERRALLAGERGPWRCHFAGECSRVCPKGVDPARAIQRMKRDLVLDYLRLGRRHRPAPLARVPPGAQRRADVPDAPPPTV